MSPGAPRPASDDPALSALIELTRDESQAAGAHLRLGDLLHEQGELAAALAHYEQSLAFDFDLPRARTLAEELRSRLSPAGPGAHPTVAMPRDLGPTARRYQLLRELGRGGAGTVYLAEDGRLGRRVALKVFHPGRDRLTERILDEARLAGGISHPGVVRIFDLDAERRLLVMEHLAGGSLRARLTNGRPLDAAETARLGAALAAVLAAVHARGIVHGDLKPANVLFRAGAPLHAPVLVDFGVARASRAEGPAAGTLAYMSPELRTGARADARSDLFALGVLLFEGASGHLPFPHSELLAGPATRRPVAPAELPTELGAVVEQLLQPEPLARPSSAAEVAERLARVAIRPLRG